MKIALEIPDAIFRRAMSAAAERGIPLQALVSEALVEKLSVNRAEEKPWMRTFGQLRALRPESARINRIIEDEFEQIESADRQ